MSIYLVAQAGGVHGVFRSDDHGGKWVRINDDAHQYGWIGKIITDAFSPLGQAAVVWAMRIAYCESRYHPNSVNSDSGASGLFQFMPGTWAGTPWASQSPFDPVANAQAAAWLYSHYGPGRWSCK